MDPAMLTAAERAVQDAFPRGAWVDLTRPGGADPAGAASGREAAAGDATARPQVRAELLAALLLRPAAPADGAVPALRLRGATVTGTLGLAFATVAVAVELDGCTLEAAPELTGATTRSVELTRCTLPGLEARLAHVQGDLRVSDCVVNGSLVLKDTRVDGAVMLSGSRLLAPGGRAVDGGGLATGGGFVGRRGLHVEGTVRLIGARIDGGVLLAGAQLHCPGGVALCLDSLVTSRVLCHGGLSADGEVQLRQAHVSGEVSLHDAVLKAPVKAVRARGLVAGELILTPASVQGMVDLSRVRLGALRDSVQTWPALLRLDGLSYDHLLAFGPVDAEQRCAWLTRDVDVYAGPSAAGTVPYRPQPYEELAAYYRRIGHDHDARRVLLAKQRRRRATLRPAARAGGYLLDATVGYGYRSWLSALWLVVLLVVGTAVFSARPPVALDPAHRPHFDAFFYSLDLLIPIGAFGLRGAYDPVGDTQWVAYLLIAAGWVLATALIAGAGRALRRD